MIYVPPMLTQSDGLQPCKNFIIFEIFVTREIFGGY